MCQTYLTGQIERNLRPDRWGNIPEAILCFIGIINKFPHSGNLENRFSIYIETSCIYPSDITKICSILPNTLRHDNRRFYFILKLCFKKYFVNIPCTLVRVAECVSVV